MEHIKLLLLSTASCHHNFSTCLANLQSHREQITTRSWIQRIYSNGQPTLISRIQLLAPLKCNSLDARRHDSHVNRKQSTVANIFSTLRMQLKCSRKNMEKAQRTKKLMADKSMTSSASWNVLVFANKGRSRLCIRFPTFLLHQKRGDFQARACENKTTSRSYTCSDTSCTRKSQVDEELFGGSPHWRRKRFIERSWTFNFLFVRKSFWIRQWFVFTNIVLVEVNVGVGEKKAKIKYRQQLCRNFL